MAMAGCTDEPGDCPACTPRPDSTLFVSDRGNNTILRYDGRSGDFEDVFASGSEQRIDRPAGFRLGPSGHAYVAGFGRGDVVRYDLLTGALKDIFYWDTTLLEEPVDLVFRADELFVLGNDTGNVVVVDNTGTATRDFGYPEMTHALDLALANDQQTIYVGTEADQINGAIQAWDIASGRLVNRFGGFAELASATSIALRDDGTLYVCDWQRNQIVRFEPATGARIDVLVPESSGKLATPVGLDFGPDGALYVLDDQGIHRLDPDNGLALQLLIETGDGHNRRPRAFTFVTEHAMTAAIARTRNE